MSQVEGGQGRSEASGSLRVFISYSRSDLKFARRLVAALEARGIETQIDERDLPALEDWRRELLDFIRAADTVIFIVSPRSIASRVCEWEIEQVVSLDKRLAPVVLERVEDDKVTVPAEIARLNYLFFDPPNDFDTQADRLAAALFTDVAWIKEHTRLSGAARRWHESGRPNAQLLRSEEIDRVAEWLGRRTQNAPAIPEALREFLAAGRKFEQESRDRLRQTVGGAFINPAEQALKEGRFEHALRLAAAGAVLAEDPSLDLVTELRTPVLRAIHDNSTELIIRGATGIRGNLRASIARNLFVAVAPEGAAVWDLNGGSRLLTLPSPATEGRAALLLTTAISPDGKRMATSGTDEVITIWEVGQQSEPLRLPFPGSFLGAELCFSENGRLLMASAVNCVFHIWDSFSGEELISRTELAAPSFSRNGRLVAACRRTLPRFDSDGGPVSHARDPHYAAIFDIEARSERHTLGGHQNIVRTARFSPCGKRLVTASRDRTARIWSTDTGTELARFEHPAELSDAVFSPCGERIATVSEDRQVRIWKASGDEEPVVLKGHSGEIVSCEFSSDGSCALTASRDRDAILWDVRRGAPLRTLKAHESELDAAVFLEDGRRILTLSGAGTVRVWQAARSLEILCFKLEGESLRDAIFHPDGRRILVIGAKGPPRMFDGENGALLQTFGKDPATSASLDTTGDRLVTTSEDGSVQLWDTGTRRIMGSADYYYSATNRARFSHDGREIVTVSRAYEDPFDDPMSLRDPVVLVRDSRTLKVVPMKSGLGFILDTGFVLDATIGPLGLRVLSEHSDGGLCIWDADLPDGNPRSLDVEQPIAGASFSADGSSAVVTVKDRTARVLDANAGAWTAALKGHGSANEAHPAQAVFSKDGRRIATAGSDETVRIWHAGTGAEIAGLSHGAFVLSAAFSEDGRRLVTTAADRSVRVWDVSKSMTIAQHATGLILAAALTANLGRKTKAESEDRLTQNAPEDSLGAALRYLKRSEDDPELASVARALRATLHRNCYPAEARLDGKSDPESHVDN
ncbi:MAG: TIR domain-containing protein [Hyphomicrobium sp.]